MDAITLCNILKDLKKPLLSEISNEDIKKLMESSIDNVCGEFGITYISENFKNGNNMNINIHNIAFYLGIIFGIIESNDKILYDLVDKVYWIDDDTPLELRFVRHLKDDLRSANKDLHRYYTKIHPKYELLILTTLDTFKTIIESLDNRNKYLIIANKDFRYCKIAGYISLISAICDDFIRKYKALDFAEVNEVNIQNVNFLIGIVTGFMASENIKDRIIADRFEYIIKQIRKF